MLLYRQDLTKNKMAANGMKETILRFNDLSYSPAMANYSLPLVGCIQAKKRRYVAMTAQSQYIVAG